MSEEEKYIVCKGCGNKLYYDDVYYPDLDLCEVCIDIYKKYAEPDVYWEEEEEYHRNLSHGYENKF